MEQVEVRKFLKAKLQQDKTTFYGYDSERIHIRNLFMQVAKEGESNSALLIGSKKSGKSTVRNYFCLHRFKFLIIIFLACKFSFVGTSSS